MGVAVFRLWTDNCWCLEGKEEEMKFSMDKLTIAAVFIGFAIALTNEAFGEEPWGYEYVPVVITWYDGVPKKTQELASFTAKGAFANTAEAKQDCEDKALSVIKSWGTTGKKFTGIVLCVERPLTKPVEKEPEKE